MNKAQERKDVSFVKGSAGWEGLGLSNDFMFCRVMSKESVCRQFIERLLHIRVGRLKYIEPQKDIRITGDARGVRFDVYAADEEKVFDIEMQTAKNGELARRARYYQAAMDADTLKGGESFRRLKESWILFLCLFDPFGGGQVKYSVRQVFEGGYEGEYQDGTHRVFYNCMAYKKENDEGVRNILKYLAEGRAEDTFTGRLEEEVQKARKNMCWRREYMTLEMIKEDERLAGIAIGRDEGILIGRDEGIILGEQRGREQTAFSMLARGFSVQDTADITGLSVERVRQLAGERTAEH